MSTFLGIATDFASTGYVVSATKVLTFAGERGGLFLQRTLPNRETPHRISAHKFAISPGPLNNRAEQYRRKALKGRNNGRREAPFVLPVQG